VNRVRASPRSQAPERGLELLERFTSRVEAIVAVYAFLPMCEAPDLTTSA
jgi:hypothetical protein